MATQSRVTSGPSCRGLAKCTARAMSSLPVPLSPSMQTLESPAATFSIIEKIFSICFERPTMPWKVGATSPTLYWVKRDLLLR